jgi:hypothetical protein
MDIVDICLDKMKKNTKRFSQVILYQGREFNQVYPINEGVISTRHRCSISGQNLKMKAKCNSEQLTII